MDPFWSNNMAVFSNILVGIDFSPYSRKALDVAFYLAEISKGSVRAAFCVSPTTTEGAVEASENELRVMLDGHPAAREELETSAVVLRGNPASALQKEATRWGADVLVVSHSGKGALQRLTFGSVCEELVKNASMPILVARETSRVPFKTISAAVDYSALSVDVLTVAHTLAYDELASLFVVHVESSDARDALRQTATLHSKEWFAAAAKREANDEFDAFLASNDVPALVEAGIHLTDRLTGTPWKAIAEHAERSEVDLVVMGRVGHGFVKETLLGSNADKLARKALCSVLVMHRPH